MRRPNRNPLTPASLATDGNQGAGAAAQDDYGREHNATEVTPLMLALLATNEARLQLARYAVSSDFPPFGLVESADLLDVVYTMLAKAVQA